MKRETLQRSKPCINCRSRTTHHGKEYQTGPCCSPACRVVVGSSLHAVRPPKAST